MIVRAKPRRDLPYGLLTNIELVLEPEGAEVGVTNDYGVIDGSGNVTTIKSVAPGPLSRDFNTNGTGLTLDADGMISFAGTGRLRSVSAATVWNFLSYNATIADMDHTTFMVVQIGTTFRPTTTMGMFGTNGASPSSKGFGAFFVNNGTTNIDSLNASLTKGIAGQYVGRILENCGAMSNRPFILTIQCNSSGTGSGLRIWVNDQPLLYTDQLATTTVPITTPTNTLEIGDCGAGTIPITGKIGKVVIAREYTSYSNCVSFIKAMMNRYKITTSDSNYLRDTNVTRIFDQLTVDDSKYYLGSVIGQNPVNTDVMISVYNVGVDHVYDATKKLVGRASSGRMPTPVSATFGAQFDIFDPVGTEATQDLGGGYDQNGRFHIFVDTQNSASAGGQVGAYHIYSDDLSTWTRTNITSSLASDGLAAWRMFGNMVHANGWWLKPYYKFTDQGDFTNSANYVLRSTDGISWTTATIRASGSTYRNEGTIVWLSGANFLYVVRDESTSEWHQYISADNGATWTSQGAVTWGETITSANPQMLKGFTLNGQRVIASYYTDRANDIAKVVYALPADLISSGVSGWNLDTKFVWYKTSVSPWHIHYGDIAHLNDSLEALAQYSYDRYPGSGTGVINALNYFTIPTWHITLIESELGI